MSSVNHISESTKIPTYGTGAPEKNPVFFEKRVYQGSSGKVYPVPFVDKVFDTKSDVSYRTETLENEFVRLVMLPEIGGRIFEAQDKTNQDYDFFYKQEVIKPALVGLAGPWISGGVEFNWPQHHRPGTYLPTDAHVDHATDGSKTVWMSELDPMNRLKGMHGIKIKPNSSLIELKGRLYNRTAMLQTFLWWANVAVRVHDDYESFFPRDVHYVADHAVRAQSSFPIAENHYYGIPYHERPGRNDLRRYQNIEVPTSYMVCDTKYDFFGGYDHKEKGGFIHFANRHIAPGKKQWTWGSSPFGEAWDRELTDIGGPYFELMAGVYTDNQPDFTYLQPFETKTFSQYWWGYKNLGPVQNANKELAIRLEVEQGNILDLGIASSQPFESLKVILRIGEKVQKFEGVKVSPDRPWQNRSVEISAGEENKISLDILNSDIKKLLGFERIEVPTERNRVVAKEPDFPESIESSSELELVAEHLEQYRHPTRYPEPYIDELIKRDDKNHKALTTRGRNLLSKGQLKEAIANLEESLSIATSYHPNPADGEVLYYLGLAEKLSGNLEKAYKHFYKATWNYAWKSASYYHLAALDNINGDIEQALDHLELSLDCNRINNKAIILKALILDQAGRADEAKQELESLLKVDALDHWAKHVYASLTDNYKDFITASRNDAQTIIDLVFEYISCGFHEKALNLIELHESNEILDASVPNPSGKSVMTILIKAYVLNMLGKCDESKAAIETFENSSPDYFFPSRLDEQLLLEWVIELVNDKTVPAFGLGNLLFDKKRHADAIKVWETAQASAYATIHRNLGIAYWNHSKDETKARASFEKAISLDATDMKVQFEYDQLLKICNESIENRYARLSTLSDSIYERDDLSVEMATLLNLRGDYTAAKKLLENRTFHPWEGGEGKVLQQYSYAYLMLGHEALEANQAEEAISLYQKAIETPDEFGEKYHPLQAKAHINYFLGTAFKALGKDTEAKRHFELSAQEQGDFIDMAVSDYSEMTYYKALSTKELGEEGKSQQILQGLFDFGKKLTESKAQIDYFATSLPNLLVFDVDIQDTQTCEGYYLMSLAMTGLGEGEEAKTLCEKALAISNSHLGLNSQI